MEPIFRTQDLTKQFGGLIAVNNVSLTLQKGELRCILGPNGCGKTTLFNLISGRYKPTSGKVFFDGQDITGRSIHLISRTGIGRKFQVPSVFGNLTIRENLRVSVLSANRPTLFTSNRSLRKGRKKITELIDLLSLGEKAGQPADSLSHGERQWLEIGMVLASEPKLMLLDEPTAGMTAVETSNTAQLIRRISTDTAISVVVIEHDINFVKELASPVTVMYKGAIFREGSYTEIQGDEEVHSIYLGRKR